MRFYKLFALLVLASTSWGRLPASRIVGGKDAAEHEYPYIGVLYIDNGRRSSLCSCSILTPTWSLTAAHCLYRKPPDMVLIYGEVSTNFHSKHRSRVEYTVLHPRYRTTVHLNSHDIGLFKTEEVALPKYARLSAVDYNSMVGQNVTVAGYGIAYTVNGGTGIAVLIGKPLQLLDVLVVKCKPHIFNIEAPYPGLYPSVCLAKRCPTDQTTAQAPGLCGGDSGGPMIHASGVAGINSHGGPKLHRYCKSRLEKPNYDIGVITPVSPYIDWISNVIQNSNFSWQNVWRN